MHCVAMWCSVLQCVAVCYSVLQCVAVCCNVLQCVAVCCSVLQCVAVRRSALQSPFTVFCSVRRPITFSNLRSALLRITVVTCVVHIHHDIRISICCDYRHIIIALSQWALSQKRPIIIDVYCCIHDYTITYTRVTSSLHYRIYSKIIYSLSYILDYRIYSKHTTLSEQIKLGEP